MSLHRKCLDYKRDVVILRCVHSDTCLHEGKCHERVPNRRLQPRRQRDIVADELRIEVLLFALAMELKLRKNDHKGGWKDMSPSYSWRRMREEVDELDAALIDHNLPHAMSEAVDSANFGLILMDNLEELTEEKIRHNPYIILDKAALIAKGLVRKEGGH